MGHNESGRKYQLPDKTLDRLLNLGLALSIVALLASFTTSPSPKKTDNQPTSQYNPAGISVAPADQRQPFQELTALPVTANSPTEVAPAPATVANQPAPVEPLKTTTPEAASPLSAANPLRSLTSGLGRLLNPSLTRF